MAFAARNSVYIRNLSPQVTEESLRETFGQCDLIERVLFRSFQGRTTEFFAQVDFKSSKGVLEAHQMSGTKVMGQVIEVSVMDPGSKDMGRKMWNAQRPWESVPEEQEEELAAATAEPKGVQAEYFRRFKEAEEDKRLRTVHIAGLAKEATEDDVRAICKEFGEVEALRMDKDNDGECFALVEFKERGSAQMVKRQEKYLVEERVWVFTEAKTMVDTTSFAEQSVQFNQPAFDQTNMKVVLTYQSNLSPKLAKAKVAALQIAGEEIPPELLAAANSTGKPAEEEPVVWEGRGEQSSPLNEKEVPKVEARKRPRDDGRDLPRRRGRRRSRDRRERDVRERRRSRSRPRLTQETKPETAAAAKEKKGFGKKVAAAALHEGEEAEEDEVEAVPNTELMVLGSSDSYSYEWSGDEEEIAKAKAARQAAKEERQKRLEERRAEEQRKAEERRKAEEQERLEAERKAAEERKEAERLAAEAAEAKAREAEAKRKAEEDIAVVNSSSQEYIKAAALRRRLLRLASKESTASQPTAKWECASCGEDNKAARQQCNNCGAPAPWVPKSFEVDDALSPSSSVSSPRKVPVPPASPKSIAESLPRSVDESPPRSIPGSSPRSIAESKAESIHDEPGDVVALSDEDGADEVQVESEKVCGELAEARARIFHGSGD